MVGCQSASQEEEEEEEVLLLCASSASPLFLLRRHLDHIQIQDDAWSSAEQGHEQPLGVMARNRAAL